MMTMTMTVLEATNLKHKAEQKMLEAIREFEHETELAVSSVDLEHVREVGRRDSRVAIVTLDVRFQ